MTLDESKVVRSGYWDFMLLDVQSWRSPFSACFIALFYIDSIRHALNNPLSAQENGLFGENS